MRSGIVDLTLCDIGLFKAVSVPKNLTQIHLSHCNYAQQGRSRIEGLLCPTSLMFARACINGVPSLGAKSSQSSFAFSQGRNRVLSEAVLQIENQFSAFINGFVDSI